MVKVFVFDWNGEDIRICSSTNDIPKKWYQYADDHVNCFKATFMKKLLVLMAGCDIAVFSTQTNPKNDYFHETILKNSLEALGYTVDTEESDNISIIGTRLKLSVCYKIGLEKFYKHGFIFKDHFINVKIPIILNDGSNINETYTEALAMYYTYNEESYVFVAVSFAHLLGGVNRKKIVRNQNDCLEYFIKNFIINGHIDYGFISGDMNYQLNNKSIFNLLEGVNKASDYKNIIKYDELYPNLEEFNMNEGVNGQGPLFMPTYALKEGRSRECREAGFKNNEVPKSMSKIAPNLNQPKMNMININNIKTDVKNYKDNPTLYHKEKLTHHINMLKTDTQYERLVNLLERISGAKKYQGDTNKELEEKINVALKKLDQKSVKEYDLNELKDNVKLYKKNKFNAVKNLLKQNLQSLKSLNNLKYNRLVELLERLTANSLSNDKIDQLADQITLTLTNLGVTSTVNQQIEKPKSPKINVSDCYQSTLAYHNRILNTVDVKCINYDRIDIANNTHHSAVFGTYMI